VTHHRRGLRRLLRNGDLADAIETDWRSADLDPKRFAMLGFTEKLTRTPSSMDRSDVESLRAAGFSDRDVLDITEVIGYYAYANRIADGLGVEVEPWSDAGASEPHEIR